MAELSPIPGTFVTCAIFINNINNVFFIFCILFSYMEWWFAEISRNQWLRKVFVGISHKVDNCQTYDRVLVPLINFLRQFMPKPQTCSTEEGNVIRRFLWLSGHGNRAYSAWYWLCHDRIVFHTAMFISILLANAIFCKKSKPSSSSLHGSAPSMLQFQ